MDRASIFTGIGAAVGRRTVALLLVPVFLMTFAYAESTKAAEVRVGVNRYTVFLPVLVAAEKGFYKAHGVDVVLQELGEGDALRTALLAGSVDMIIQAPEGSALLYEQGQTLVNVVATQGRLTWVLGLSKALRGRVEPGDYSALRGKRIGVPARGTGAEMQLQALLRTNHLDPRRDVSIVATGTYMASLASVEHGQLDGMMLIEPATSAAEKAGVFAFADYRSGDIYPNAKSVPMGALATLPQYIDANPEVTKAVVESVVDAMIFMRSDPDWTSRYIAKISGIDLATAQAITQREFLDNQPEITELGWNTLVGLLVDGGTLKKHAPYAMVTATQFQPIWDRYKREPR